MRTGRLLFAAIICASAALGQGPAPIGGEFQINSYTTANQQAGVVAALSDGGLVAVWNSSMSSGSDSSAYSIQGQRYGADGTALGTQFQVNTFTPDSQWAPAVAALTGGGFVTVWRSWGSSGSDSHLTSIHGRRYGTDGIALGDQFQINSYTTHYQFAPAVAALADGGFVALWESNGSSGSDSSGYSIQGQRYGADGAALGAQFQVNSYTTSDQWDPAAAAFADGGFVVTWHSHGSTGSDSSGDSVQAQLYAADGAAQGAQFQVNSYTDNSQLHPSVATWADDRFVVVWHSYGSAGTDGSPTSIQGRLFAAGGNPRGGEFQVNSHTDGVQGFPAVAALADAGFMVVWESDGSSGSDTSGDSILGQLFTDGGTALAGEIQINSYTNGHQLRPSVTALGDGGFAAAWTSNGSSGSDISQASIQGRRFALPRYALVGLGEKCLDVEGASDADGTPVNLYQCHGGENQRWQLELTSTGQRIRGLGGKCLVPGTSPVSSDPRLVIGECGGPNEIWRLEVPAHARPSALSLAGSDLCISVEEGSDADGTPIRLSECRGEARQFWRPAAEICVRDSLGLCLNQQRFRVELEWQSFDGTSGIGKAVPVASDDSSLLWFFEDDNWEMLIKVLDGCAINDRLWVFAAATTTVEYTLRVTDTHAGTIREYFNPLGTAAAAITDVDAFATCPAGFAPESLGDPAVVETTAPEPLDSPSADPPRKFYCHTDLTRMCLSGRRFSVEATWRDHAGNAGSAQVVPVGSSDSGLFWFFDSGNWELLVKVLNACHINGRFLFLGAATTDVEYTLTVTDVEAQVTWQHTNALGTPSEALVHWFDTCDYDY